MPQVASTIVYRLLLIPFDYISTVLSQIIKMARGKAACNKWYEKTVNKSLFFLIGKFKRKSKLEIFVPKMILKYFLQFFPIFFISQLVLNFHSFPYFLVVTF